MANKSKPASTLDTAATKPTQAVQKTMKAVVIRQFGDFDVLKHEEIPTPTLKPGHILIKVLAAGANRLNHYIREGSIVPELPFPHILGSDASGEVAQVGEGVRGFEIGERVVPLPGYPQREEDYQVASPALAPSFGLHGLHMWGAYAQYMQVPARWVLKDKTSLRPEEVATFPVPLGTAVHAIKTIGQTKAGDKILIHSGASGSGSLQIQVAKVLGAEVATTVRGDDKGAYATSLGADLVINTRKEDFVERVKQWTGGRGADVVIDNLGGDVLAKSIDAAKPQGIIVAFGFAASPQVSFDIRQLFFAEKQLRGAMASNAGDLEWGLEQVRAGRIKPSLDRTLPLSQASEAHRLIASNQVKGTIVLLPWAE